MLATLGVLTVDSGCLESYRAKAGEDFIWVETPSPEANGIVSIGG